MRKLARKEKSIGIQDDHVESKCSFLDRQPPLNSFRAFTTKLFTVPNISFSALLLILRNFTKPGPYLIKFYLSADTIAVAHLQQKKKSTHQIHRKGPTYLPMSLIWFSSTSFWFSHFLYLNWEEQTLKLLGNDMISRNQSFRNLLP